MSSKKFKFNQPETWVFLSQLLLLGVLSGYLVVWFSANWGMLANPDLQTDDARTSLFPFHRYGPAQALADDPIAQEMLGFVPLLVRLLYQGLVPFFDIFVSAKIVQALALGILLYAGVILTRSRRVGLAGGVLLVFLVLHDTFAIGRVAGGLPRAFGFPLFALWVAGIAARRRRIRYLAPCLAALTYPSVLLMILAGEGLYSLRGLGSLKLSLILRRLRRYAILVAVSLLLVLPAATGNEARGPIYSLQEAKQEPAFGRRGRLWILPFADPVQALGDAFVDSMHPRGALLAPPLTKFLKQDEKISAVFALSLLFLLPLLLRARRPQAALSFIFGAIILYFLSRFFAFRLYSPERYYSYGMRMGVIFLLFSSVASLFAFRDRRKREAARNVLVSGYLLLIWALSGSGAVRDNGMTINRQKDRPLYEYIATLPKDIRVASHIFDGDGIPLFSARATMGGFETLQPWFVDSWARQKDRAEQTIDALYASDLGTILAYAQRNRVTHFLINTHRYGRRLRANAGSFEPFTQYANRVIAKNREPFFGEIPVSAVEFSYGRFRLVSVAKLAKLPPRPKKRKPQMLGPQRGGSSPVGGSTERGASSGRRPARKGP